MTKFNYIDESYQYTIKQKKPLSSSDQDGGVNKYTLPPCKPKEG